MSKKFSLCGYGVVTKLTSGEDKTSAIWFWRVCCLFEAGTSCIREFHRVLCPPCECCDAIVSNRNIWFGGVPFCLNVCSFTKVLQDFFCSFHCLRGGPEVMVHHYTGICPEARSNWHRYLGPFSTFLFCLFISFLVYQCTQKLCQCFVCLLLKSLASSASVSHAILPHCFRHGLYYVDLKVCDFGPRLPHGIDANVSRKGSELGQGDILNDQRPLPLERDGVSLISVTVSQ